MKVGFHNITWHSTYRLHHKKVEHFSKDNIFFVGDAAHVHSPVGGQGMNTGLQDAYNLAWKLALVVKGQASPALLETYHEERNPVAENLLKSTDRIFQFMSTDSFWYRLFRLRLVPFFAPLITRTHAVRKLLFRYISQIQVNYISSSLVRGKAGKISAGLRLPYFKVTQKGQPTSTYQIVNKLSAPFKVMCYDLPTDEFKNLDAGLFDVIAIDVNPGNDTAVKVAGLPTKFAMVVRPDNYIGYISQTGDVQDLNGLMKNAYGLKTLIAT
jgi:hypothetical protein